VNGTSQKRIMIFGIPGSGKSVFALKLSRLLHLPLFQLDKYFFVSGRQERNHEEFLHIQKELVQQEYWVIDGNATKSLEMRFSRADTVIYLRLNRLLCLWRIFKRLIRKNPHISDRAEGCSENVSLRLIKYLWGFPKRVELSVEELRKKYPSGQFYEFRNDAQVNDFLRTLRKKEKYVYKPYSNIFPDLFLKQKNKIASSLKNALAIEHVGSTAIPNLGGKGIIDIAVAVARAEMESSSLALQNLGYEFRPSFSTPDRLYFMAYLEDPEEGTRRYHIHLTYLQSKEWKDLIEFRDYLRSHPKAVEEYAEIKKEAANTANQDGKQYRNMKEPLFRKIRALIEESHD